VADDGRIGGPDEGPEVDAAAPTPARGATTDAQLTVDALLARSWAAVAAGSGGRRRADRRAPSSAPPSRPAPSSSPRPNTTTPPPSARPSSPPPAPRPTTPPRPTPAVAVPVERRPLPPASPAASSAASPAPLLPVPPSPVPSPSGGPVPAPVAEQAGPDPQPVVAQPAVPRAALPPAPAAVPLPPAPVPTPLPPAAAPAPEQTTGSAPQTSELPASGIPRAPQTSAVPAQTAGPRPTLPPVPVAPPVEPERAPAPMRTSAPVPPLPGTERARQHSAPVPPLPGTERAVRNSAPVPPLPGLRPATPLPPIPGRDLPAEPPAPLSRADRRAAMSPLRRRLVRAAVVVGVLVGLVGGFYVGLYFYADRSTDRVAALSPGGPEVLAPQLQVGVTTWLVLGTGAPGADGPGAVTAQLLRVAADEESALLLDVPATALVDTPVCRAADGELRQPTTEPLADALLQGGPSCLVRAVQQLSGLRIDHLLDVDLGRDGAGSPACPTDALPTVDVGLLANPVRATSTLLAAADAVTLDEDTSLADLRALEGTLRDLPAGAVQRASLPVARVGYVPVGGGTAQLLLDGPGTRDLFEAVIRTGELPEAGEATEAATVPASDDASVTVAPGAVTVTVLDATGDSTDPTTGAGATTAAALAAQGFVVGQVALEPAVTSTSVVRYAPEAVEQAHTVAAAVPGAVLESSTAVGGGVQLVVAAPDLAVQQVAVGAAVPTTAAPATVPTATCG
jgi:hypothetical protein